MADALDQDVHALKEWLRRAWRYLAEPKLSRFERRELRNYMKEAEAALRAGLGKLSARDRARLESIKAIPPRFQRPDLRILSLDA